MARFPSKRAAAIGFLLTLCLLSGCAGNSVFTGVGDASIRLGETEAASRYYYRQLDETEKSAYTAVWNQAEDHPERIPVPALNDDQLHRVFHALSYDNPELICLGNSCQLLTQGRTFYLNPEYACEPNTCVEMTDRLEKAVSQVLTAVPPDADAYTVELFFHDWLVEHCTYEASDETWVPYTAYGALVDGRAACEGYARAMQLLLNRSGISNYLITGEATDANGVTQGHMWNIVTIDGAAYHLDVTWDDPVGAETDQLSRAYFNITDIQISADHDRWDPAEPGCTATQANYFVRSGLLFDEYGERTRSRIAEAFASAANARQAQVEFRFANEEAYQAACDSLLSEENSQMYRLITRANLNPDIRLNAKAFTYIRYDALWVLRFDIPYLGSR